MKNFMKEFCKRGLMYGAWGGPLVMAIIVVASRNSATPMTAGSIALGILTTEVLGFIAAGVTAVYQVETLPKAFAALIQFAVLYVDYLGIYLLNGWIAPSAIWFFSGIFVAVFAAIWLCIYIGIKCKVNQMNKMLNK